MLRGQKGWSKLTFKKKRKKKTLISSQPMDEVNNSVDFSQPGDPQKKIKGWRIQQRDF
jgi:hypothetical protein